MNGVYWVYVCPEHHRGLGSHPAQHGVLGIDQVPFALDRLGRRNFGFHVDRRSPVQVLNYLRLANGAGGCQTVYIEMVRGGGNNGGRGETPPLLVDELFEFPAVPVAKHYTGT